MSELIQIKPDQAPQDYMSIIDEVKSIMTEGIYIYRTTLIETYHRIGELIATQRYATVKQVSTDTGISERTLQRCVQFYEKYPDTSKLPEGKNISWHKIVHNYLPEHKGAVEEYEVCPTCLGKGKIKK